MRYEQIRLVDAAPHFEAIAEIVAAVRETRALPPIDALAALHAFARRGDTAVLAWENDILVGVTCLGLCHHFIAGPEWMRIKVRLVRDGHDLARIGCSHFVYLHPDHWQQGATSALTEQARTSNPDLSHTLLQGFATKELEIWAANLPGVQDVGLPNPHAPGQRVFLRKIV